MTFLRYKLGYLLGLLLTMSVCSCSHSATYPWSGKPHPQPPPYNILETENPVKDQYMVTYAIYVRTNPDVSRNDIQLISEKVIETLPPHNMALICFIRDQSEKDKDWTIARTWWGCRTSLNKDDPLIEAGDYSTSSMKIAMKGEELPGVEIKDF